MIFPWRFPPRSIDFTRLFFFPPFDSVVFPTCNSHLYVHLWFDLRHDSSLMYRFVLYDSSGFFHHVFFCTSETNHLCWWAYQYTDISLLSLFSLIACAMLQSQHLKHEPYLRPCLHRCVNDGWFMFCCLNFSLGKKSLKQQTVLIIFSAVSVSLKQLEQRSMSYTESQDVNII